MTKIVYARHGSLVISRALLFISRKNKEYEYFLTSYWKNLVYYQMSDHSVHISYLESTETSVCVRELDRLL